MAFILHMLSTYDEHAYKALKRKMVELQLGIRTVAYEGVSDSPMLDFPVSVGGQIPK